MRLVSIFILSLFGFQAQATPPTMEEIRTYLDQIKQTTQKQQPFFMFPEENNGIYEYIFVRPLDCAEFSFRDSVGLRKSNGYFSFFRSTRVISLYDVEFVELRVEKANASNFEHYVVAFGQPVREIAKLIYSEREDERGVQKLPDSSAASLGLRYSSREDAEQVLESLRELVRICQGN